MPQKTVEGWLGRLPTHNRAIAEQLRQLVGVAAPTLTETIKWGNPTYVGNDNVCYLASGRDYVSLGFFRATSLADPSGLLEGTGKSMRHVKVHSAELQREALGALVREAVTFDAG